MTELGAVLIVTGWRRRARLSQRPLQINFYRLTFGASTDANQAKQLSTDSLRQPPSIDHSSPVPRKSTRAAKRTCRGGTRTGRAASHSCRRAGKTLSGFIWVQCVSCSLQLQIETSEQEREKKSNEKNFLKEVE